MIKKKKSKAIYIAIASIITTNMFINSVGAIEKVDESKITDENVIKIACSHKDIIEGRVQSYPAKNFTIDNVDIDGNDIIISNPSTVLSIANNGICRLLEIEVDGKIKKILTIEYKDAIVSYSDFENEEILVKNGEIVNMNNIVAKATKVKMSVVKPNGESINAYQLMFNDLYPRGGMRIPLFSQLDKRWKNNAYGDSSIYIAGCGPSSLAMIYSYFEKKIITPEMVVNDIGGKNSKYMISGQGSAWSLLTEDPKRYGIKSRVITADQIKENLKKNRPVIALMGNGYFTNCGHYIVLRGIDKNGNILVNDPADFKNNYKKSFSIDLLKKQNKHFWAYYKDKDDE